MPVYSLVWCVEGVERRQRLDELPVFIGRVSRDVGRLVPSFKPYGVYIYYPGSRRLCDTGVIGPQVSRFHAKIFLEGGVLYVQDHGVDGRGSLNGTYVDGVRLEPGSWTQVKPGSSIRLGATGPVFTLVQEVGEGEAKVDFVTLPENIPIPMPKRLAEKMAAVEGVKVEVINRDEAVVVAKFHGVRRGGGITIQAITLPPRETLIKHLMQVEHLLQDAQEYITGGKLDKAKDVLTRLRLRVYREAVEKTDDQEIINLYNEVARYSTKLEHTSIKELLDIVRRLKSLVRGYIEAQLA